MTRVAVRCDATRSRPPVRRVTPRVFAATDIRGMSRRVIDRGEWVGFLDAFSRQHDGWLVSVAVERGRGGRQVLTRDTPLHGVVAELSPGEDSMMVFTDPRVTHYIEHPVLLAVLEDADGADAELTITGNHGARTIVSFRSPMRPELVDGLVHH